MPANASRFLVSDVRNLAIRRESMDAIISTSTLDHFDTRSDFEQAIGQLAGALRPGGVLVITLDNPQNPLYALLRWASRRGWTPFRLGYTPSLPRLCGVGRCRAAGDCHRRIDSQPADRLDPALSRALAASRPARGRSHSRAAGGFRRVRPAPDTPVHGLFVAARACKPQA